MGTTFVQRVTHFFQQQFDSHDVNLDGYLDDISVPWVMLEFNSNRVVLVVVNMGLTTIPNPICPHRPPPCPPLHPKQFNVHQKYGIVHKCNLLQILYSLNLPIRSGWPRMPLPLLMGEWVLQLLARLACIHYTARCLHARLMSILQPRLMNGQVACRHHDTQGCILIDLPVWK